MNTSEILVLLNENSHLASAVVESTDQGKHPHVVVKPEAIVDVCKYLKEHELLKLTLLRCISAIDWPEKEMIELSYDLLSIEHGLTFAVKVRLDRSDPQVASVSSIWPAADWHERETYDLMGVKFLDHPDLQRILLPEDWVGHPLRKDYVEPEEYHGITAKR